MEISHLGDEHANSSEASLAEVADFMGKAGRPIRLRLPIQLWNGKVYVAWKQEVWKVEVTDVAEAKRLRGVLEMFFTAVHRGGLESMEAYLHDLLASQTQEPVTDQEPSTDRTNVAGVSDGEVPGTTPTR